MGKKKKNKKKKKDKEKQQGRFRAIDQKEGGLLHAMDEAKKLIKNDFEQEKDAENKEKS